jgi:hypothetical protein
MILAENESLLIYQSRLTLLAGLYERMALKLDKAVGSLGLMLARESCLQIYEIRVVHGVRAYRVLKDLTELQETLDKLERLASRCRFDQPSVFGYVSEKLSEMQGYVSSARLSANDIWVQGSAAKGVSENGDRNIDIVKSKAKMCLDKFIKINDSINGKVASNNKSFPPPPLVPLTNFRLNAAVDKWEEVK